MRSMGSKLTHPRPAKRSARQRCPSSRATARVCGSTVPIVAPYKTNKIQNLLSGRQFAHNCSDRPAWTIEPDRILARLILHLYLALHLAGHLVGNGQQALSLRLMLTFTTQRQFPQPFFW